MYPDENHTIGLFMVFIIKVCFTVIFKTRCGMWRCCLRVKVYNLGPLEKADICLGELVTLFVGPNNIGKTILSRAIYAFGKSIIDGRIDREVFTCCLLDNFYSSVSDLRSIIMHGKRNFSIEYHIDDVCMHVEFDGNELHVPQNVLKRLKMFYVPSFRVASYFLKQNLLSIVKLISDVSSGIIEKEKPHDYRKIVGDLLEFQRLFRILRQGTPKAMLMNISSLWYSVTILDVLVPILRLALIGEQPELSFRDFIGTGLKYDARYDKMYLEDIGIPLSLTSAGMLEVVPMLLTLDYAYRVSKSLG